MDTLEDITTGTDNLYIGPDMKVAPISWYRQEKARAEGWKFAFLWLLLVNGLALASIVLLLFRP
jgi:hypothetical protein